ncbi:hypothetical protein [Geoalkalibacter halelectricus]|uniref:hypothetical protein n=1 Tax=Geoalkalibacter halelectricus TaxID=2847045 RepID=UPI00266F10A6|nr:hypothetical protein [Geoalkalibacter halelectricus]MDO3380437.1 hypothetical protein [Geoalkalibacter halelectricus]
MDKEKDSVGEKGQEDDYTIGEVVIGGAVFVALCAGESLCQLPRLLARSIWQPPE